MGKTTIVQQLKEQIENIAGLWCEIIAFPGNEDGTLGKLVYDIHHQEKYFLNRLNETSLQLLHVASHIDLIERRIKNLNQENCIVLLDRFWWSTFVYGCAGSLEQETIEAIIAPEKIYWQHINIKKIFLIEREEREHDYSNEKEKKIIELYRMLAKKDERSMLVSNNTNLNSIVTMVRKQIVGE